MTKKLFSLVATMLIAVGLAGAPALSANAAASISAVLPSGGVADGATATVPVTVSGVTFASVRVDITAANGTVAVDYSSVGSAVVTPGYDTTDDGSKFAGTDISFSANKADAAVLLASHLTFTSTQTGGTNVKPEISITISEFGVIVNKGTGHTYVYSGTFDADHKELSWAAAQAYAASTTRLGHNGYLVNIGTSDENDFIKTKSGIQNVWIGATDDPTEVASINTSKSLPAYVPVTADSQTDGHMIWGGGSEAGQIISNGLDTAMAAYNGSYQSWSEGEPNNYHAGEGCGVTNWGAMNGLWNDLPCTSAYFYMVEYDTTIDQAPLALTYDSANALANTGGDLSTLVYLGLLGATLVAAGTVISRRENLVK
jgi:hypothetical protein